MKNILLFLSIFISTTYASPLLNAGGNRADSVLICQSKSAKVYHKYECGGLANCTHQVVKITKSAAIKMGRRACKNCYK